MDDRRIDISTLEHLLDKCFREDGSVDLRVYLEAYRALHRFFCLLGKIFSFVAIDIESKINTLERHLDSLDGSHYETVQSMVAHEKARELWTAGNGGGSPNGARTLLRLHWSMEFIIDFLQRVLELADDDRTCPASQEAYRRTLGKHHNWLIHRGALLAMHALPTAEQMVKQTCTQTMTEVRQILPRVIEVGRNVFLTTNKVYEDYGILDLP